MQRNGREAARGTAADRPARQCQLLASEVADDPRYPILSYPWTPTQCDMICATATTNASALSDGERPVRSFVRYSMPQCGIATATFAIISQVHTVCIPTVLVILPLPLPSRPPIGTCPRDALVEKSTMDKPARAAVKPLWPFHPY